MISNGKDHPSSIPLVSHRKKERRRNLITSRIQHLATAKPED
jgi:hypothetical protein